MENTLKRLILHIWKRLRRRRANERFRETPEGEADRDVLFVELQTNGEEARNHTAAVRHSFRNLCEFRLDEPYPRRTTTRTPGFGLDYQRRPGGRTHIGGGKGKSQLPPLKSRAKDYVKQCRAKRKSGPPV